MVVGGGGGGPDAIEIYPVTSGWEYLYSSPLFIFLSLSPLYLYLIILIFPPFLAFFFHLHFSL
jgi:hypothetical protein